MGQFLQPFIFRGCARCCQLLDQLQLRFLRQMALLEWEPMDSIFAKQFEILRYETLRKCMVFGIFNYYYIFLPSDHLSPGSHVVTLYSVSLISPPGVAKSLFRNGSFTKERQWLQRSYRNQDLFLHWGRGRCHHPAPKEEEAARHWLSWQPWCLPVGVVKTTESSNQSPDDRVLLAVLLPGGFAVLINSVSY